MVEHERGRRRARRHDKGLYAETTDEDFMTDALAIGLDIALVPGKAKRCLRYLDDEEIKVSVGNNPDTITSMISTGPTDSIFTWPRALGSAFCRAPALLRTMLNSKTSARAGVDAKAATARAASAATFILVNRFRILRFAFIL